MSLLDALRHKGPEERLTLEFRHDVYKYLFNGKGRDAKEKNWVFLMKMTLVNVSYHLIGIVYLINVEMVSNLDFLLK